MIVQLEPVTMLARRHAWIATDKGSRRAPSSKETLSGNLQNGISKVGGCLTDGEEVLVTPLSWVIYPCL